MSTLEDQPVADSTVVSDTTASVQQDAAAAAPPPPPTSKAPPRGNWRHPAIWIALIALLVGIAHWWLARSELQSMQDELAARLAERDSVAAEARMLARQNQDVINNLQGKLGAMEAQVAEARGHQSALESAYQEFARGGDERIAAEVEEAVNAAIQQLRLGAHIDGALLALQTAESRLAATNGPAFDPLRRALAQDIDALKALPVADLAGAAAKLDAVAAAVDAMPLAYVAEVREGSARADEDLLDPGFWRALGAEVWRELRQLVRVERLDRPAPGLLAPEQAFFLRENVKLRLVNARLGLLQRDTEAFRSDIAQAREWLSRYFDGNHRSVATALKNLDHVSSMNLRLELPTLEASRTALLTLKAGRGKAARR